MIDDCYNANPMSMRAAIDELSVSAPARRVAVLGDMLELGPQAESFHRELGRHAQARGVELLVTVGPLAAAMREEFTGESHGTHDAGAAAEMPEEMKRMAFLRDRLRARAQSLTIRDPATYEPLSLEFGAEDLAGAFELVRLALHLFAARV